MVDHCESVKNLCGVTDERVVHYGEGQKRPPDIADGRVVDSGKGVKDLSAVADERVAHHGEG